VTDRRVVEVPTPVFGWEHPWPNAFEIACVFSTEHWTLVGGLMAHLHSVMSGVAVIRPTDDLDMLLHIEIATGLPAAAADQLERLGYVLQPPRNRKASAYRFTRARDVIDVMAADHVAPSMRQTLRTAPMFEVEGGTQALQRTMICVLINADGSRTGFSVPDELGALVLKGAAYLTDSRDRDRHLYDAAVLAATVTDHAGELERLKGNDVKRLRALRAALHDPRHPAWLALPEQYRLVGQDTLRILTSNRTPDR
jgi:hypothetical protein